MLLTGLVIGLVWFGWSVKSFSLPELYCIDKISKESLIAHGTLNECSSLMKKIMYIGLAFGVFVVIPLQLLFVSVLRAYRDELNEALEMKNRKKFEEIVGSDEYTIDWETDDEKIQIPENMRITPGKA